MLSLAMLASASCAPDSELDRGLQPVVRQYLFDFASWETSSLLREAAQLAIPASGESDEDIQTVIHYFAASAEARAVERQLAEQAGHPDGGAELRQRLRELLRKKNALEGPVERIIEVQVRDAFAEQGIFNPTDTGLRVTFPPMNFRLGRPPSLLVVSPRERIETLEEIALRPDLTAADIEEIESGADAQGVSSLVVRLGGLGATYPTFVTNRAGLRFTLATVAEEWLHQHLTFRPLGFLYVLDLSGIAPSYEIATLNETVASMVSDEIAGIVYGRYYEPLIGPLPPDPEPEPAAFDFNREMRRIRRTVDAYLERGEVERAEEFMQERRRFLADNGYYIRRLNQAYFAFHGAYADDPTSISPIGADLRQLRSRSTSLKGFLDTAARLTSHEDLRGTLSR